MDVFREPVAWVFEGPLIEIVGLPALILYGLVMSLRHGAGRAAADAVQEALLPVAGTPRTHRGVFATRLAYEEGLEVRITRKRVRVASRRRVKPKRLRQIVAALAVVPESRDLHLKAERERFGPVGSRQGAPMG